jgi:tetratricopeptide (TPR) repeat protein
MDALEGPTSHQPIHNPPGPALIHTVWTWIRRRHRRADRSAASPDAPANTAEVARLNIEIAEYERRLAEASLIGGQRAAVLNNMAIRLRARSSHTGEVSDLDRALEASRTAVDDRDPAMGDTPWYLTTLGNCLIDRFVRTASHADLDEAISAYQRALDEPPDNSAADRDRRLFQANLANAFEDRYRLDGRLDDLNSAISLVEGIGTLTDSLQQAGLSANYAAMLLSRYTATGKMDDLDHAIDIAAAALPQALPGTSTSMALRVNLSGALQSRYNRTRQRADLDVALHQLQIGLTELQPGAVDRAMLSNNLGTAYATQALANTGEQRRLNLELSVAAHRAAVRSAGKRDRPSYLNDLGGALLDQYQETRRRRELRAALRAWRTALAETPAGAPSFARRAGNLARGTAISARVRANRRTLAAARRLYTEGCRAGLDGDPEAALANATDWGSWASGRMAWDEAAAAYDTALVALERLFRSQLLRAHKQVWLATATGLPAAAALAQVRRGNPQRALDALERSRAMLLSEALGRDRANLKALREQGRDDLVDRFAAAANKLATLGP